MPDNTADTFTIAGKEYNSRLLVGTGKYKDMEETGAAIAESGAEIVTVAVWGDILGGFDPGSATWAPPDGRVDFIDILGTVEGFADLTTAPSKELCDVYPGLPDRVIDFGDISTVVDAFQGESYTLDAPVPCD